MTVIAAVIAVGALLLIAGGWAAVFVALNPDDCPRTARRLDDFMSWLEEE